MRVSREEMDRSHARIVQEASRLFRANGIENTSVADVMRASGLTHGGFYRHFESKDALVRAAIQSAFSQLKDLIDQNLHEEAAGNALALYHRFYLSDRHLSQPGEACPVAILAGEVARAAPQLKGVFGTGVKQMIDTVAQHRSRPAVKERRVKATREFAMLVGAAVIARACDPETAENVLEACR